VRGALWKGVGHCVQAHIPGVFRDLRRTGEDIGRVRAWCLGESVSLENGSPRGSTYHKKYIGSLN
jgi:hypothetical protein